MSDFNVVQDALPANGVPANGVFDAVDNIVNNTFNTASTFNDSPFNGIYIGDSSANIVGTATTPYLPMALPAYIPTLYENMYHVQTNLKNEISLEAVPDNREYPTIYAVKEYVAKQLAGTEFLTPDDAARYSISTGVTSSFLVAGNDNNSQNVAVIQNSDVCGNTVNTYITTYDIKAIDTARSGGEKVCINTSSLGQVDDNTRYYMQIVLTDASQAFVVNGKEYKVYVFSSAGDALSMYQYKNPNNGNEIFFVLTYGGLFSNNINVGTNTAYYPLPTDFLTQS